METREHRLQALDADGQNIEPHGIAGQWYKVDEHLTAVRILKQRGAIGAGTFAVGINQNTLEIYDPQPLEMMALN